MNDRVDLRQDVDFRLVDLEGGGSAVLMTADNSLYAISAETRDRLIEGSASLTPPEREAFAELGMAPAANAQALAGAGPLGGAVTAINVNLTALCNLACSYCFADGGDYGRIKGRLSHQVADDILAHALASTGEGGVARFEFFGGEPLLNFETMAYLCARATEVEASGRCRFRYRISTNLTVLPKGALDLFARHGFIVSVSIDGGRETHDRNRPHKGGRSSWDGIIANCRSVRALGDEVTLVARMTATGGTPRLLDDVRTLHSFNLFDWFQIYPAVVPASAEGGVSIATGFFDQLEELLAAYGGLFEASNRFRGVLEYERLAQMIAEGLTAVSFCSAGRQYSTFSPDRSVMPCHRLVGEPDLQIGLSDSPERTGLEPWRKTVLDVPNCAACAIRFLCGGGCKQENLLGTGSLNVPASELCHYQFALVDGAVRRLAQGKSAGRGYWSDLDNLFVSCGRPVVPNGRARQLSPNARAIFSPLSNAPAAAAA